MISYNSYTPNNYTQYSKGDLIIAHSNVKNVSINIAEELEKNNADLVYPIMIAYQQPKRCDYYDGIKKCIDHIEERFNTGKFTINASFPIKVFFMFFSVDDVKKIKEQVIKWISDKEPLIS